MADKPDRFWKRLKSKLTGRATPPPAEEQAEDQADERVGEQADEPVDEQVDEQAASSSDAEPTEPKEEPSVLSTSELTTDNVGRVYAEALLELATEQGVVDELADQVQSLLPTIVSGGELHRLLANPAIGDDERGQIVKRVFEGKVHDLLYKMLRVLGDKGRLGSLPEFAGGFLLAVAEARGQVDVQATVATELSATELDQVAQQIGKALGKTVSLKQKVDPSLIGGMKIKVGDQLIDASVASQLQSMKNKMIAAGRG